MGFRVDPDCGSDYGLPADELDEAVRRELARSSKRPPLPHDDPSAVRASQGYSTGIAFAVTSRSHFVTSEHLIHGADRVWIVDARGKEHPVEVLAGDEENDPAILRSADQHAHPIPIAGAGTLDKGEEVFTLGYPLLVLQGQEQKATFGRVNALSGAGDDGPARGPESHGPHPPGRGLGLAGGGPLGRGPGLSRRR